MAKQIQLPSTYPVPDNWKWVKLQDYISMKSGFPFDSQRFSPEPDGKRPLIRIRDVVKGFTSTYTDEECPEEYIIHFGDILIGMDGDFNIAKWQSDDALLNQRVCCISSKSNILLENYLFYYLPDPLKKINDATPSVTVKHLSTKTLAQTSIPLPPLPEQQRIVDRIESIFAKLDEAKEKAQAVVDGYELRKSAILHKAFTGELTKRWRAERKKQNEWSICRIQDFVERKKDALKAGPFGSALKKSMYVDEGYKIYGQEQVISGDETIGNYYINEEKYQELLACKVSPNDILISLVGTVGKVLVLSENCKPGIINPRLIKVSVNAEKMLPYFFKFYFESSEMKAQYKTDSHGITMDVLNMGILKQLKFPVCPVDEQMEVIRIIEKTIDIEKNAVQTAEAVLDQIDTMKKAVLARAFRGELGTNDPAEESAIELLKRILNE